MTRALTYLSKRAGARILSSAGILTSALFLFQSSPTAHAAQPQILLSVQKLRQQGLDVSQMKAMIFVKLDSIPRSMVVAEEPDDKNKIFLSGVQFFGSARFGVWLRTSCDLKSQSFSLQECRGTVCQPAAFSSAQAADSRKAIFAGEFGHYSLQGENFARKDRLAMPADTRACNRVWPAWALNAKAHSFTAELTFPHNILLLQDDSRIHLVDALNGKLWNSLYWDSKNGVFNQASLTEEGQILLKNNSAQMLFLDFPRNRFVAVNGESVFTSYAGLNSLFAWTNEQHTDASLSFPSQDGGNPQGNLGGLWWKNGYLDWDDLATALLIKKTSPLRPYPNGGTLLSALWTDQSGIEKSYVLLNEQGKQNLYSKETKSNILVKSKYFARSGDGDALPDEPKFIHPEFITEIDNLGQIHINEGRQFNFHLKMISKPAVVQSGLDMLTLIEHPEPKGRCRLSYFKPVKNGIGWREAAVLPNVSCGTGIGRTPSASGLIESTPTHIKIYILDSTP
jgi:hypothetical protein